jgi:hypothetical protein
MAISNGYATLTQVKAAARITDTVDDSLLEMAIETASRMIDGICERRFFTAGTESRYYVPASGLVCDIDDLAGTAITVVVSTAADGVFDLTWAATDYQLEPLNNQSTGLTFAPTRLRAVGDYVFPWDYLGTRTVKVTGVFGFGTAVPMAVQQATIIAALRTYKRLDSPLGVAGFGDMGAIRVTRVDPDVQAMLAPYRRSPVGIA